MVINENNAQINTFVKGMNTDTVYDQVDNQLYVYGENIRITKNIGLGGNESGENYSSVHEGCVAPVPAGKFVQGLVRPIGAYQYPILGTCSIDKYAVILMYTGSKLRVYRSVIDEENGEYETKLWCEIDIPEKDRKSFSNIKQISIVPYQELEGVIKLYIATGVYPIMEIRIDDASYEKYQTGVDVDNLINNRILPTYPVYIDRVVDGSLKTSQVLYTYRYYNKFGITTLLAPLTNKIQVIDPNRSKETGNAQDTQTSIGFSLIIKHRDEYTQFDRLLIFRLSYITAGEDAKVEMIYDGDVSVNSNEFKFNDVGTTPLAELTMEEFAAMSGMVVIPKVIEQNQQYMFASNIKDDTIIPDLHINPGQYTHLKKFKVKLSTNITGIPSQDSSPDTDVDKTNYLLDRNVNPNIAINSYNNIFTSSLLRSLRRGEEYSYGIVYYDKYGRRSNVQKINSISVPEISEDNPITTVSNALEANICGVTINLPQPLDKDNKVIDDIIGCQIVRRSSKKIYLKILLQVALARPVKQKLYTNDITNWSDVLEGNAAPNIEPKDSPYYPTGFLWSGYTRIFPGYIPSHDNWSYLDNLRSDVAVTNTNHNITLQPKGTDYFTAVSKDNNKLFQIFSSEIDFRRDDMLSVLKSSSLTLHPVFTAVLSSGTGTYSYQKYDSVLAEQTDPIYILHINDSADTITTPRITERNVNNIYTIDIYRHMFYLDPSAKSSENNVFPLYNHTSSTNTTGSIKSVKDVKLPEWFDGFSNLQLDGADIAGGGIKKYQQFNTNIDEFVFNNWISFGLYDHRIAQNDSQQNNDAAVARMFLAGDAPRNRREIIDGFSKHGYWGLTRGIIGPGTSCFLMTVDELIGASIAARYGDTVICNIEHQISEGENEPDEFVQYFGFGNFFRMRKDENVYHIVHNRKNTEGEDVEDVQMTVFDGDIYITPQELATMYKTYDFMSYDTLQSTLVINYVPMESKVNTFFDYGMNYLNTNSANLMTEPGSIDGVTTQDRPVHQYNLIYSANDESNDVFTLVVEKSEDNQFKQRTYYSEPKTNGEYVDNFVIFKPAAYIDVDPKYGEVTNLLTNNNTLYYWQDTAFGKFSVNERSLINDTNGNTIMLGQAGILSRNDYISTKFGMRPYDYCAIGAENGVYWVDINNKAVVAGNSNECVNFGERLNVQNIINARISDRIPKVHYDVQNNELLCNCLQSAHGGSMNNQLVFNLKLNIAVGECDRNYEDIVSIKNHLYGVYINPLTVDTNPYIAFMKYNYLSEEDIISYLHPLAISFVVNPSASTTKVFDSQQVVPAKRISYGNEYDNDVDNFFYNKQFTSKFETDINSTTNRIEGNTSREGNIIYNIPRYGENDWGNRLRGKWMRVDFNFQEPDEYTTISHVITKFRQSYS